MNLAKPTLTRKQAAAFAWLGLAAALACLPGIPATQDGGTQSPPDILPTPTDVSGIDVNQTLEPGPGDFYVVDTRTGLEPLKAYTATLAVTFEGTRDGKAEKSTTTTVMRFSSEPAGRQMTVTTTSDPAPVLTDPLMQTEINGILYKGGDTMSCSGEVITSDTPALADAEPITSLPGVLGAEDGGTQTVNDVGAQHYTFDEKALALGDGLPYSGELWVATDGGYVVKYLMSTKAGADYLGEGVEGTITWEYNLTGVNQATAIDLPAGCPVGALDVPVMSGATDVVKSLSEWSYQVPGATIDDVLAFYSEKLPTDGWELQGEPLVEEDQMGTAIFKKGDLKITVQAYVSDGVTHVTAGLGTMIPTKLPDNPQ